MDQSPYWETDSSSRRQEITHISWNTSVHYRNHKSPPPVPIVKQINSVHDLHHTSSRSTWILCSQQHLWLPTGTLSLGFSLQNPVSTSSLPHKCHLILPSHFSWFHQTNNIWWAVQINNFLNNSFFHSPVTSSLLGPNILLNILLLDTLSLLSSLNVSYHISSPCKTTDKIIVLYILIFVFLDSKLEDKSFRTGFY